MSLDTKAFAELVDEGLALLRKRAFFEAHERFEDAFRGASAHERLLAHGLAQLAAAHHQLSLGRARASVRTWQKAEAKLALADMTGLEPLALAMRRFHERLGIGVDGPRFIELSTLPPRALWPVP